MTAPTTPETHPGIRHDTDGALVLDAPQTSSPQGWRYAAGASVRRYGDGTGIVLTATETGPRGGATEVAVTVSPRGTDALRAELRPRPTHPRPGTLPERVTERAADVTTRLASIEAAVGLLRQTTDPTALAALSGVVAEVGELLASALVHAVPEERLAAAGRRFR